MLDQTAPRRPTRARTDRCPGLTRPWLAEDGALVRIRLVGGALTPQALAGLSALAATHGDGDLHLTSRANVQVRGVPHADGRLPTAFVDGVLSTGLVPSTTHELVRNIMVSPFSGRLGGRADLRPVAARLDRLLLADPACSRLAGRFLFLLDDGRGDLVGRGSDLAAVAVDADTVQLRAGLEQWGPLVPVGDAAAALHAAARRFLHLRGAGSTAPWHVDELADPLWSRTRVAADPSTGPSTGSWTGSPPQAGQHVQDDGRVAEVVDVPDGRLSPDLTERVLRRATTDVVVTPWHSVLVPDLGPA